MEVLNLVEKMTSCNRQNFEGSLSGVIWEQLLISRSQNAKKLILWSKIGGTESDSYYFKEVKRPTTESNLVQTIALSSFLYSACSLYLTLAWNLGLNLRITQCVISDRSESRHGNERFIRCHSEFQASIPTYKFSRLISIHFLKELFEGICWKITAFSPWWSFY